MVLIWRLETDYTADTAAMSLCVCKEHLLLISTYTLQTRFVIPAFSGTDIHKRSCNIFTIATSSLYLPAPCPHTNLLSCTMRQTSLTLSTLHAVFRKWQVCVPYINYTF